MRSRK